MDGGTAQTAPQVLTLSQGTHTIAVASPQAVPAGAPFGTQCVFKSWSDSGTVSHTITVGSSAATYTASFITPYLLTISGSPAAGGMVTPASSGYYNAGTVQPFTATANAGYTFNNWSGPLANAGNASITVTMNAPENVIANFSSATGIYSPAAYRVSLIGRASGSNNSAVRAG